MNDRSHASENSLHREELSGVLLESVEAVLREPVERESLNRAMEQARQIEQDRVILPRKSKMLRRTLVFSALAATLLLATFFFWNKPSSAWAQVVEAVAKKPWLQATIIDPDDDQKQGDLWFSTERSILGAKCGNQLTWIDFNRNELEKYIPEQNTIVKMKCEGQVQAEIQFINMVLNSILSGRTDKTLDAGTRKLIHKEQMEINESGKQWIKHVFEIVDEDSFGEIDIFVNPDTQLPFRLEAVSPPAQNRKQRLVVQRWEFNYPSTGPTDIYALGVPKSAKILGTPTATNMDDLKKREE
jgi:hypothetical protein